MAKRIAPFRNVDPHDEISNFALDNAYVNNNITGTGFGDAGILCHHVSFTSFKQ